MKQTSNKFQQGFSLIEIMIVLAILGLIASIIAPSIMSVPDDAKIKRIRADFANLEVALKMYKLDNQSYPSTEQGLRALMTKPSNLPDPSRWRKDGYMPSIPKDPWNKEYHYESPGDGQPYVIYTLGANATRGGKGIDKDMTNWSIQDFLNH